QAYAIALARLGHVLVNPRPAYRIYKRVTGQHGEYNDVSSSQANNTEASTNQRQGVSYPPRTVQAMWTMY
ncbi:MAG: hypothetical protein KAS19_05005, partial [Anaerolineales bacterium]|nr:hypothetical protein [Anaerolineales bacterium]